MFMATICIYGIHLHFIIRSTLNLVEVQKLISLNYQYKQTHLT